MNEAEKLVPTGFFGQDWKAVEPAELQYLLGLSDKVLQHLTTAAPGGGIPRVVIGGVTRYFLPHVRAYLAAHYGTGDLPVYQNPPPAPRS